MFLESQRVPVSLKSAQFPLKLPWCLPSATRGAVSLTRAISLLGLRHHLCQHPPYTMMETTYPNTVGQASYHSFVKAGMECVCLKKKSALSHPSEKLYQPNETNKKPRRAQGSRASCKPQLPKAE